MDSLENLTAVAADDDLRKAMIAAEGSLFAALPRVDTASPDHLFLHLHEDFFWNNGIVVVLDIVLRHITVVLNSLLRQEVFRVGLLKKCIADIFFIPQYLVNVAGVPFFSSSAVQNTISLKATGYF